MPTAKNTYLIAYNLVSAAAWAAILSRVILTLNTQGWTKVFAENDDFLRYVQTGALLEIVHSLVGLVRAPLVTTALQVVSRLFVVWGVAYLHPAAVSLNPLYTSMLVAWSITEVVRYSYFVFNLIGAGIPGFLSWLRYNGFFVLYPVGITSELTCVWKALGEANRLGDDLHKWVYWIAFAIYVPGSYILYTHMMAQRRRVIRGKGKAQ